MLLCDGAKSRISIDKQITKSIVCDTCTCKGSLFKQIKLPLVVEDTFTLTGLFADRLTLQMVAAVG